MRSRSHLQAVGLSLSLFALACGGPTKEAVAPESLRLESSELGGMHNVSSVGNVWLGGLPSVEDLDLARRRGIERVIDLRVPEETLDYDLRGECARLGLECVSISLQAPDDLPDSAVNLFVASLADTETPTLVFCGDGSRSAMFFAVHRVVNGGLDVEEALYEARCAGMQPGAPEEFVRAQIQRLAP